MADEQYVDVLNAEQLEKSIREDKDEAELPEKFKGKTKVDIAKSYTELEQQLGKQGKELGELRQLADSFIKSQLNTMTSGKTGDGTTDTGTTTGAPAPGTIDPKFYAQELAKVRKMETELALREAHPDMQEVIKDPAFAEYVKSSKMRTRLYLAADQEFDFDAANELLTGFKATVKRGNTQVAEGELEQQRQAALKAGTTTTGSGSESGSKKVYRRADLIRLKQLDPERYLSMADEIQKAYQDGRVR